MNSSVLIQFLSLLPENPSKFELEKGYKALAQIFHPDRNPTRKEWAEEKMKQLNEAKDILSNPIKRQEYIHIYNKRKAYQNTLSNHVQRLQAENSHLKRAVHSSNQANGVLGLALLLVGGSMLLGS